MQLNNENGNRKNGNFELVSLTEVGRRDAYTATGPHAVLLGRICCLCHINTQKKTLLHEIGGGKFTPQKLLFNNLVAQTGRRKTNSSSSFPTKEAASRCCALTLYQRLQSENQLIYWSIFHNFRLVFRAVVLLLPHCQS